MTISKKYRSYGIRRLNNFSDIENPVQALNNLLNNLQERPNQSFISEDLDVIRGLKDTEVFPSTLIQLEGSASTFTFANTLGPQEDFVRPLITLQDKINTYRSVTGAAGKQGSGYGPNGWFVPVSSFNPSPSKGDVIDDIVPNFSTDKSDFFEAGDFWNLGEFFISRPFHPTFTNGQGGIVWESFYIPDYTDTQNVIGVVTTGLFHIEVDIFDTGNWVPYKSIYASERTVIPAANNNSTSIVNIIKGDERYIVIGDKLSTNNEITVTGIVDTEITLSDVVTAVKDVPIAFQFDIGKDLVSDQFAFESAFDIGRRSKMRIAWWYPDSIEDPEDRYLQVRRNRSFMLFSNFSNTESFSTGQYELANLLDRGVTNYQPSFGDSGEYKNFQINDVLRSNYAPPLSFSSINKFGSNTSATAALIENREVLKASPNPLSLTSIGNVIVESSPSFVTVGKNTRIKRTPSDNIFTDTRILTKPVNATANVAVRAIDHNGLVDYFIASSANTTIKVDTTASLRPGMVCVTHFTGPSYYRINSVANTTAFIVSSPLGITSNNYVFVYSDSGFIDSSKQVFCQGVIGKLITSLVYEGSNTININSTTGLTPGMRVQYTGGIEPSSNYTIVNITGDQVRLDKSITVDIGVGATITFAPSVSTGDKQQCVIPLDLSPPFIGKDYGLDTGGKSIVSLPGSNLDITVLALSSNTTTVSTANTSDVYSSFIRINGTYKIKARTIT